MSWLLAGLSRGCLWASGRESSKQLEMLVSQRRNQKVRGLFFCQLSATRKRAISVPDLNAGLKR